MFYFIDPCFYLINTWVYLINTWVYLINTWVYLISDQHLGLFDQHLGLFDQHMGLSDIWSTPGFILYLINTWIYLINTLVYFIYTWVYFGRRCDAGLNVRIKYSLLTGSNKNGSIVIARDVQRSSRLSRVGIISVRESVAWWDTLPTWFACGLTCRTEFVLHVVA